MKILERLHDLIEADKKRQAEQARMLEETKKLRQLVGAIVVGNVTIHVSSLDNLPPTQSIFE